MKKPGAAQTAAWIGLYLTFVVLPLAAALVRPVPPARGFWIELGVGLGFAALAMLGLQFALTARFRRVASPFGIDTQLHFHRQAGIIAACLALAHALVLVVSHPPFLAFLDPRDSAVRALALWVLLISLALLIGLTLRRREIRLDYDLWRLSHGLLGTLVLFIGLVHVFRVGHYIAIPWKQALWLAMTGAAIALLFRARVLRPLRLRGRPYRVTEIRPERGDCWTLALESDGHEAMQFEPGQFAWLTLGDSPFSLEQHPFSFSSSALQRSRLEMTVKELGDFTNQIGEVVPGTTAFLEGPYGAFTLDPDSRGAAFFAGGIGITPVMSILRTMRDRGDMRPVLLLYANRDREGITFREEIDTLAEQLDMELVHVLEDPPGERQGEHGYVTPEMIDRILGRRERSGWEFFVCGPEPMMDLVEEALLARGVRLRDISSERFNIA
jgi:predicted ferric reductase